MKKYLFSIDALKYGSEEKGSWFYKCSTFLGFITSKKQERLRSELLSEDKITNLFFDIIKPKRIEHLQNQESFFSVPYFRSNFTKSSPIFVGPMLCQFRIKKKKHLNSRFILIFFQGSRWTFQATRMNGDTFGFVILPDMMQVSNPVLILAFIPIFDYIIYPILSMFW